MRSTLVRVSASLSCAAALLASGCSDDGTAERSSVALAFPAITVAPGDEIAFVCQSVTLDNDEPIAVTAVTMTSGPAWHHANWFWVPENRYAGPDGTWGCGERDFDTAAAGIVGGVLYAMSTQARGEVQRFQPGAALVIPPRSRIVGEVHLINASDDEVQTSITLDIESMPASEIDVRLQTLTLVYFDLALPPRARSRFSSTCDLASGFGAPIDISVHYVLPHYHALGTGLRATVAGGPADGQVIYDLDSGIGEPLGGTLAAPVTLEDADGVRFSCDFDNPTDATVTWGLGGYEMCVALMFVDSRYKWLGTVMSGSEPTGDDAGVATHDGPCQVVVFPGA